MAQFIGTVTIMVQDYDEAISFYTKAMGFIVLCDEGSGHQRRVVIKPKVSTISSSYSLEINLVLAITEEERKAVGNQCGGRVFLILNTDDFARDYEAFKLNGVTFLESPRDEVYGQVVIFQDLYGNKWDLIQRK